MIKTKTGLCFDDVLLVPKFSDIQSRSLVDLSTDLGKGVHLKMPVVSANMKTITGSLMAAKISSLGGLGILHRFFDDPFEQVKEFEMARQRERELTKFPRSNIGVSVGVTKDNHKLLDALIDAGAKIVCVDVAHGNHSLCIEMTNFISTKYPHVLLISGNVVTPDGALNLYDSGADIVKVGIGNGCFAAGTRVLMANATYKNIEDINPGDRVINGEGKPTSVINAFCTGIKEVYKMRNNLSGVDTIVTPDHNFWVGDLNSVSQNTLSSQGYVKVLNNKNKNGESKYKWKSVDNLKQDCLLLPRAIEFELSDDFEIDIWRRDGGNGRDGKKKIEVKLKPGYELGYIFGTFLGDGHAMVAKSKTAIGSVRWYFGQNEIEIASKVQKYINILFGREPELKWTDNTLDVVFYHKPFADFLHSFDIKENKYLPSKYIINNKIYLQGIYDGLIDSDGHVEKEGRNRLSNTSLKIIELFNIINYLLTGSFPNSDRKKATIGGLSGCNLDNCKESYTSYPLKSANKRLTELNQVVKILECRPSQIMLPVYDITVDCESHSFIANNSIVHNSLCSTRIETGNGYPQLSALEAIYDRCNNGTKFKVLCDGGVRRAGDFVKALCYSHLVMSGNMLSATIETPGEEIIKDGVRGKIYQGSSTHKPNHTEGVVGFVPLKGPVEGIIQQVIEGIKSGCSYQGAHNLEELRHDPTFITITQAGLIESHPHDISVL